MSKTKEIYCCGCGDQVDARLTDGQEIYPHRPDLSYLPFWKCDECGNYVGCHHKTDKPTRPLGCIPTPELMKARSHIHAVLDPIWKSKTLSRRQAYKRVSAELGYKYHTANIKSIEEARKVYRVVADLNKSLMGNNGKAEHGKFN
jgi:hypothetical protein